MARRPKGTVTPRGDVIRALREGKGWNVQTLASKADCSIGTISNLERSQFCYLGTLQNVAAALGTNINEIKEPDSSSPTNDPAYWPVGAKFDFSLHDLDQTGQLVSAVTALGKAIRSKHPMLVVFVQPGCVELTLSMHADDIKKLYLYLESSRLYATRQSIKELLPMPMLIAALLPYLVVIALLAPFLVFQALLVYYFPGFFVRHAATAYDWMIEILAVSFLNKLIKVRFPSDSAFPYSSVVGKTITPDDE